MKKDFEIKFVIDGVECGSSWLTVENGKLNTESAEESFYSVLRKNEKGLIQDAGEEERSHIVDNLLPFQEDKLREVHAKQYTGTDDDMADDYEDWLVELGLNELKKILV